MVEEEDNDDDLDKAFQSLAVSRAANLEVGVDTAAYNEAAKGCVLLLDAGVCRQPGRVCRSASRRYHA